MCGVPVGTLIRSALIRGLQTLGYSCGVAPPLWPAGDASSAGVASVWGGRYASLRSGRARAGNERRSCSTRVTGGPCAPRMSPQPRESADRYSTPPPRVCNPRTRRRAGKEADTDVRMKVREAGGFPVRRYAMANATCRDAPRVTNAKPLAIVTHLRPRRVASASLTHSAGLQVVAHGVWRRVAEAWPASRTGGGGAGKKRTEGSGGACPRWCVRGSQGPSGEVWSTCRHSHVEWLNPRVIKTLGYSCGVASPLWPCGRCVLCGRGAATHPSPLYFRLCFFCCSSAIFCMASRRAARPPGFFASPLCLSL